MSVEATTTTPTREGGVVSRGG